MTPIASFLSVPVKARIAKNGELISADPPVWRLHMLAGGADTGPIALPGFAALAAIAIKTAMRIERPIRAVDEDHDVELWVEASPSEDFADILITGWRDITSDTGQAQRIETVISSAVPSTEILIDSEHRIVRLPSFLPHHMIGKHFGAVFIIQSGEDGRIPILEGLTEKKAIIQAPFTVSGNRNRFLLDLIPQFLADGSFIGHSGVVHIAEEQSGETKPPKATPDLPMSRQLASVLKQPLDRIVANAETIGSRIYGPLRDNYAEYARDIANAARHLAELVSDMEDLDAIDRPDFSVARDRIELGDITRRVCGLLALKASDHGISLVMPGTDTIVPAIGEFRRVLQILLNLVGNAIRYAPGGSTVTVIIEKQGNSALVSVSDEGQGVPIDDRDRVFEKFERLGRSGDGGSGLGLFISRRLARAMNGDLSVLDAQGGGALFRLTLPAR